MTGSFKETADCFGGAALISAGSADIVLVSFDSDGTVRWSSRYGGFNYDSATTIFANALGSLVLAGNFGGTVDLGDGAQASPENAFIMRLRP